MVRNLCSRLSIQMWYTQRPTVRFDPGNFHDPASRVTTKQMCHSSKRATAQFSSITVTPAQFTRMLSYYLASQFLYAQQGLSCVTKGLPLKVLETAEIKFLPSLDAIPFRFPKNFCWWQKWQKTCSNYPQMFFVRGSGQTGGYIKKKTVLYLVAMQLLTANRVCQSIHYIT